MKLSVTDQTKAKTRLLRAFENGDNFYATLSRITDEVLDTTTYVNRKQVSKDLIDICDKLSDDGQLRYTIENYVVVAWTIENLSEQTLARDLEHALNLLNGRVSVALQSALVNELTGVKLSFQRS